jgi:hypothetical protein
VAEASATRDVAAADVNAATDVKATVEPAATEMTAATEVTAATKMTAAAAMPCFSNEWRESESGEGRTEDEREASHVGFTFVGGAKTLDGRERFTLHPSGQHVESLHISETQQIPSA